MTLKICVAQLNLVVGDLSGNSQKIIQAARAAYADGDYDGHEAETIGDKRVVHNYGHGGSGWSLAWGSAAAARDLIAMGFDIIATRGTADWLRAQGVKAEAVNKVYEGRPNIVDRLKNGDIALVMNTTEGTQAVSDSRDIRRVALMDKIPYFTTAAASIAAVAAMKARGEGYGVRTLQG